MPLNQDALFLEQLRIGRKSFAVAIVCDGIGGFAKGEEASALVTGRVREYFHRKGRNHAAKYIFGFHRETKLSKELTEVLHGCCLEMHKRGEADHVKMGTTCTLLLVMGRKGRLLHVGDSRAYLVSAKRMKLLTKDDRRPFEGNTLTRCIGSFPWKGISNLSFYIPRKSCLLLCSDGFWEKLTEAEIHHSFGGLKECNEELLQRRLGGLLEVSRNRGEKDNASGVVIWAE